MIFKVLGTILFGGGMLGTAAGYWLTRILHRRQALLAGEAAVRRERAARQAEAIERQVEIDRNYQQQLSQHRQWIEDSLREQFKIPPPPPPEP